MALLLLTGCDTVSEVEEVSPVVLPTYEEVTFSSGSQSIEVHDTGRLGNGKWEAGAVSPDLRAWTFAGAEIWIAGMQKGVIRANMPWQRGNNLIFSPIVENGNDGSTS